MTQDLKSSHNPWLDWLRFLAAFLVVLSHTRRSVFVDYEALAIGSKGLLSALYFATMRLGTVGVIMFFVLSGFLVGGRALQKYNNGTFDLRSYNIDRFARIAPPLIIAIILTGMVQYITDSYIDYLTLLGNLFSLQDILVPTALHNDPLWSLGYEVWFYILVAAWAGYKNSRLCLILLVIVGIVFTKLSFAFLVCWLIGIFIKKAEKFDKKVFLVNLIGLAYAVFCLTLARGTKIANIDWSIFIMPLDIARIIVALEIAILIRHLIALQPKGIFINIDKMGTKLASFSYTLYLTHFPILELFKHYYSTADVINKNSVGLYMAELVTVIIASLIFYHIGEKHTNKIKMFMKGK